MVFQQWRLCKNLAKQGNDHFGQITKLCLSMNLWGRAGLAGIVGLSLFGWVSFAGAQDKGSARDVQTSCLISNIPELGQLSVTWTGDCVGNAANGVGNVFAFSRGELRYILRGQFTDGRLTRRDQLQQCMGGVCSDQVTTAVLRAHAALVWQTQTVADPPPAAVLPQAPGKAEIRAADALYRGNFVGNPQTGVLSGEGRVEFVDGRVFIGRLEEGKKVGRSTYIWANGQRYSGDWRNDQQDGAGEWTSPEGDRYVGEYRLGKREGKGVMTYASKIEYSGSWLADQPSGRGTFRYPNGDIYEGDVLSGEQTGNGTLTHQNGDRYTGQWVSGQRDGTGLAEWKDRQRYEGTWRRDRKEGVGSMRFPDGGTYVGQWRDDRASGQGRVTFASGDIYDGEVINGVPNGKGLYTWGSGDKFEGQFENGKPTSNGVLTFHIDPAISTEVAKDTTTVPLPTSDVGGVASDSAPVVLSQATLCSRGYNAARSVVALRRFMESFPDDECGRHALARQKIAALEENERKVAREQSDRQSQAKALIGLVVAYKQDYSYCVTGTGSGCQRVVYQFEVKGKIREVNLARQAVQVQVADIALLGYDKGASPTLFVEGRAGAIDAFRKGMVGTTQWKTKADLGLAF